MIKHHFNYETGQTGPCRAKDESKCPYHKYGHYDSPQEARHAYQEFMRELTIPRGFEKTRRKSPAKTSVKVAAPKKKTAVRSGAPLDRENIRPGHRYLRDGRVYEVTEVGRVRSIDSFSGNTVRMREIFADGSKGAIFSSSRDSVFKGMTKITKDRGEFEAKVFSKEKIAKANEEWQTIQSLENEKVNLMNRLTRVNSGAWYREFIPKRWFPSSRWYDRAYKIQGEVNRRRREYSENWRELMDSYESGKVTERLDYAEKVVKTVDGHIMFNLDLGVRR